MQKRIIGQYILADSEYLGAFCIQEHKTALTQSMCELSAQFCRYISLIIGNQNNDELQSDRMLCVEAIEGRLVNAGSINNLFETTFGTGDQRWVLAAFVNNRRADLTYREGLKNEIKQTTLPTIVFNYEAHLLCLLRANDIPELENLLKDSRPLTNHIMGVSMPFNRTDGLALAFRQALFSLEQGAESGHTVCHCQDYAFEYLLGQMKMHSIEMELMHPALRILKEYDEKKKTNFHETLYQYLAHDRNLVDTAKAMYIHRNSLLYRIRKIKSLVHSELETRQERLYIQLSYAISHHDKSQNDS